MAFVPFPSKAGKSASSDPDPDWDDDDPSPDGAGKMSFLDHLDELRKRIVWALVGVVIGFAISIAFLNPLWDFVMGPMQRLLGPGQQLIYTDPTEALMLYVKIAVIAGILIASPLVMYQVWLFIAPGLYVHEKKAAIPFVVMSSSFFIGGAAFAHYLVFPLTWTFLGSFANDTVSFMPRVEPAFSLYMKLILTFGLIFQMPTLVLFLAKLGLVSAKFLIKNMKYADPDHVHRRRGAVAGHRSGRPDRDGRPDVPALSVQHPARVAVRQEAGASGGVRSGEVARLLEQLSHQDPVRRDAAVARLRVLGARAVPVLLTFVTSDAAAGARAAALAALEGSEDARAVAVAREALAGRDAALALAAVGVLRGWLAPEQGTEALEALTVAALDRDRDSVIRLAALDALSDLPPHLVAPIRATSALDTAERPAADASAALEWLAAQGPTASLASVHDVLSAAREAERVSAEARREDWRRVRGAAHVVLARRGSRLALYDLRDTFGAATAPLPLDFLTAVAIAGDDTCLEPLARAWAAASKEPWWRDRVMEAAGDIARRAGLTGRHGSLKRLRTKWPHFHDAVLIRLKIT